MRKNTAPALSALIDVLHQISDADYTTPCTRLNNNTIGGHVRHIIELFQCLLVGYNTGTVNYDSRKRDKKIETDKLFATQLLTSLIYEIDQPDKSLKLCGLLLDDEKNALEITTNFFREVLYNIEHAIHHMALIRVGINEINTTLQLSSSFGIAASTIQYQKECAQ